MIYNLPYIVIRGDCLDVRLILEYSVVLILPTIYLYMMATFIMVRSHHLRIAKQVAGFAFCLAFAYTFEGIRLMIPLQYSHFFHFFLVMLPMNIGLVFVLYTIYDLVNNKASQKLKFSPKWFIAYPFFIFLFGLLETYVFGSPAYIWVDGWIQRETYKHLFFNTILTTIVYIFALGMFIFAFHYTKSKIYKYYYRISMVYILLSLAVICLWELDFLSSLIIVPSTPGLFLNLLTATFFGILILKLDLIPSLANRYMMLMKSSPTAIIYVNENYVIVDVNDAAKRIFNFHKGTKLIETVLFKHDEKKLAKLIEHARVKRFVQQYEIKYWHPQIGERIVLIDAAQMHIGIDKSYYFLLTDVTLQYQQDEVQHYLAYHDSLTGVYNRAYFEPHILTKLEQSVSHSNHALLLFDINHFKLINDQYGHQVGDEVIKFCATELKRILPPYHVLARIGGDEFIVFMEDIKDMNQFLAVVEEMRKEMRQLVYEQEDVKISISISFGVAFTNEVGYSYEALYQTSDSRMYEAKRNFKEVNDTEPIV